LCRRLSTRSTRFPRDRSSPHRLRSAVQIGCPCYDREFPCSSKKFPYSSKKIPCSGRVGKMAVSVCPERAFTAPPGRKCPDSMFFPVNFPVSREFRDLETGSLETASSANLTNCFGSFFTSRDAARKRRASRGFAGCGNYTGAGESREAVAERTKRPEYLCRALIHWRN
jgi:hypothetical protein